MEAQELNDTVQNGVSALANESRLLVSVEVPLDRWPQKMNQRSKVTPTAIEAGQIWQMPESSIQITLMGRTLVHYKHLKPGAVRVPVSLIKKTALEQYFLKHKAVLVQA